MADTLFSGPTPVQAFEDTVVSDASFFSPCCNTHGSTVCGDSSRASSVALLLSLRSPYAITRRVIPIIIYALKRHTRWAPPHVGKKVFELHPSFADFDASTAVSYVRSICFRAASSFHAAPTAIRRRVMHTVLSLRKALFSSAFTQVAPARLNVALSKAGSSDELGFAAITLAKPMRMAVLVSMVGKFNDDQSSEPLPLKLDLWSTGGSLHMAYYNAPVGAV